MTGTRARLEDQTRTWSQRLDRALREADPSTSRGEGFLDNIRAYRKDSEHFLEEGDLVRAFEAIVWAWAWLEIGAEIGAIDWRYPDRWGPPPSEQVER